MLSLEIPQEKQKCTRNTPQFKPLFSAQRQENIPSRKNETKTLSSLATVLRNPSCVPSPRPPLSGTLTVSRDNLGETGQERGGKERKGKEGPNKRKQLRKQPWKQAAESKG